MKWSNVTKFCISVLVSESAGVVGSFFTLPSITGWYQDLEKPPLNPPDWIFAPVWTTLFFLMGVAAFLIWKRGLKERKTKIALGVFLAQLILNTLWSVLFFGLQSPLLAFIEILLLWTAIVICLLQFYRLNKVAGILFLPYFLWVSFASYLNYSIWILNS